MSLGNLPEHRDILENNMEMRYLAVICSLTHPERLEKKRPENGVLQIDDGLFRG